MVLAVEGFGFLMWISPQFCGKVFDFLLAVCQSLVYINPYFFKR